MKRSQPWYRPWYKSIATAGAILLGVLVLAALSGFTQHEEEHVLRHAAATVHLAKHEHGTGSAVAVAPGRALTAAHVVENAPGLTVAGLPATVLYVNYALDVDLAVVSVPGLACPCAPIADYQPGYLEEIAVVGYPHAIMKVLTTGRQQGRMTDRQEWIVTAQVAEGNSGGGAFNRAGALSGILTGVMRAPANTNMVGLHVALTMHYLAVVAGLEDVKTALYCANNPGLCFQEP